MKKRNIILFSALMILLFAKDISTDQPLELGGEEEVPRPTNVPIGNIY
jgi:hypothetical protein